MRLTTDTIEIKRHGKHYTPADLADFLASRTLLASPHADHLRVLDPACGDGELLLAMERVVATCRPGVRLTLTGYDLDANALTAARARAASAGVLVDLYERDFLTGAAQYREQQYDVIITNPPYVRTQQLGQLAAQRLATEFGLQGRIDLTHPFVSLAPNLLRPGGVIGLLCSNRFLTTKAGANIRAVLSSRLSPLELYDLGDTKLFSAAVLPAIVIAEKGDSPFTMPQCTFVSAYEASGIEPNSDADLYEALSGGIDSVVTHADRTIAIRAGSLVVPASTSEPWRLSHSEGDEWLRRIEKATWKTFGQVGKIRVGIKTTADSVFISDRWNEMTAPPETELLRPLVTHENVTPWRVSSHLPTRVLYPYELSRSKRTVRDMREYPAAMAYLRTHEERLRGRKYVIDGGRQWFEIWVPQKPSMWAAPKIIFPDISVDARFAYDTSGAVVNGDCYWISLEDIGDDRLAYLMLAVANSKIGTRFYDEVCGNRLYSGRRRWMTQYVSRLPIPDPTTEASKRVIEATRRIIENESMSSTDVLDLDLLVEGAFLAQSCESATGDQDIELTLF